MIDQQQMMTSQQQQQLHMQQFSQQMQRPSFADAAAAAELQQLDMRDVPPLVREAIGLGASALPLLPKKNPHMYSTKTFVTQLKYAFETPNVAINGEDYYRRNAMKRAEQITIVYVPGTRPYMFLHNVGSMDLPTPVEMRTTTTALTPKRVIPFALAPQAKEPMILQGSLQDLGKFAEMVQLKWLIGKDGEVEYWEAVGFPIEGTPWRDHLLSAPLRTVTSEADAVLRATARLKEVPQHFAKRFGQIGHMAKQLADHVQGVLINGFEVRIIAASAFTPKLKKALLSGGTILKSIFTDAKMRPVVPAVNAEKTANDVEAEALPVAPPEQLVYAHSAAPLAREVWDQVGAAVGVECVSSSLYFAAFRGTTSAAAAAHGVVVGDILMSQTPLG